MKLLTTTALTLGFFAMAGCAQAQADAVSLTDKSQIEAIVKSYLLENPELIRDVLIELEAKQGRETLAAVSDALHKDPRDVSIGPKDAKVTIVEFFDYNCGFCKKSTQWLKDTMEEHPNDVRVIFKELPILDGRSKTSRNAAKAALAASRQGKYSTMHFALMAERSLTPERVRKMAAKAGLDMDKFDKDMNDAEIERQIDDTILLSDRIPALTGTPFFVIGDEFVSGANIAKLESILDKAL
ncbi:MAG: DsbA family protein [Litorimonas sp.]